MPKENIIRKKAIEILKNQGYICWFPSKARFKQNDIFGIIDLLAWKGKKQRNIQLTTLSNTSAKRKKIISFLKKFKIEFPIEIWSWDKKNKIFRNENIKINIKRKN